jgi:hypothetical protein
MPSKIATKTETANASSSTGSSVYILNENTVNYDRSFGDHHLNVLGGFTYENKTSNTLGISVTGLTDDIQKYNNYAAAPQANRTTTSGADENTRLSYLGRINYDYKSRYYLTVTGRSDGASNFAENHKWGFFPSFGAKWRVSDEPFFKSLRAENVINNLAFRVSYGLVLVIISRWRRWSLTQPTAMYLGAPSHWVIRNHCWLIRILPGKHPRKQI